MHAHTHTHIVFSLSPLYSLLHYCLNIFISFKFVAIFYTVIPDTHTHFHSCYILMKEEGKEPRYIVFTKVGERGRRATTECNKEVKRDYIECNIWRNKFYSL
ncbi:Hypothetical predicted protein [Octopus vulgaris]|uniref:Uncharacterized protein n=1 Tax=Octopus vulgaris TaxID=6645 RepID=A0AA36FE81_OCTVU|nr:Hypothetical predicted protein [Octopus vulgaris]